MIVAATLALLVLMFVAILGGIVYWVIISQRRGRAEKQDLTLDLGFRAAEGAGGALAARIVGLHGLGFHQKLTVRNLLQRQEADCDVYLFDLEDSSNTSTDPLEESDVAVVSSGLDLPRFSVFPKAPGKGKLAGFANHVLRRFALGDRHAIEVGDNPRFDQQYVLAGESTEDVRKVMTGEVLDYIAQKLYRQIEAGGNMLTYGRIILDLSTSSSRDIEAHLRVIEALEMFRLLRTRR